jgi:hypothetical protein
VPSSYRFSGPFLLRLTGAGLVLMGVVVLVLVALVAVLSLPGQVLGAVVVLAAAGIVACAVLWLRRPVVVRLDAEGYVVRWLRGAGVRRSSWRAVEDVVAETVAGARCVVLRLRDGRTTTVPVAVLECRPEDFVADLRRRLNQGHGYRPLTARR